MQRYVHRLCLTGLLAASLATTVLSSACAIPVAWAKLLPDNTFVDIGPVVVTVKSPDLFYVQDAFAPSGIRARKLSHEFVEAMMVQIAGKLQTEINGERVVFITNGTILGPGPHIRPLFAANRYIGGEDFHFDPGAGLGQRGISGGIGLNNVGTLVSVSGVMRPLVDPQRFEIDDGSGAGLTVETTMPGLIVEPFSHYEVTGAVSLHHAGGLYTPVVWVGHSGGIRERYGCQGKCTAWIGDSNEIDGPDTLKKGAKATYSIHQPVALGCGECKYRDDGVYRWADCDETVTYQWYMHGYIPGVNGRFEFVGATDKDTVEIKGTETGPIDIDCTITIKCKSLPGCDDSTSKNFRKKITITDP